MERKRRFNVRDTPTDSSSTTSYSGLSLFKKSKQGSNSNSNNIESNEKETEKETSTDAPYKANTHAPSTRDISTASRISTSNDVQNKRPRVSQLLMEKQDPFILPPIEKKPLKVSSNTNCIFVNPCQRGNKLIKYIINVPWEYKEIIPDYEMGDTTCALFLSLRYHNLNPDYIHTRLKQLGRRYTLRVLLVYVDIINSKSSLSELAKLCMLTDLTLILAWSEEEAGRYLETYKSFQHKSADILKEPVEKDFIKQMQTLLTSVKSINRTDAITLFTTFGSFKNIVNADFDQLTLCPGFGPQKAQRLSSVLRKPFKRAHVTTVSRSTNQDENVDGDEKSTKKSPIKNYIESSQIVKPSELLQQKDDKETNDNNDTLTPASDDVLPTNNEDHSYEALRKSLADAKALFSNSSDSDIVSLKPADKLTDKLTDKPTDKSYNTNSKNTEKSQHSNNVTLTNNKMSFTQRVRENKQKLDRDVSVDKTTDKKSEITSSKNQVSNTGVCPKTSKNISLKNSRRQNSVNINRSVSGKIPNTNNMKSLSSRTSSSTSTSCNSAASVTSPIISVKKTTEISQEEYEGLLADSDNDSDDDDKY